MPDVVVDERTLMRAAEAIGSGTGPVGIDAERASGYRYGQRAYLVQISREGSGTWLIDPIACPDLSPVGEAIGDAEWILHAATQDLPCLAEVGLRPHVALRHRARRPSRRAATRRPRRDGRALPRPPARQGALGRRLVGAARSPSRGCCMPPSTSRCSSTSVTRWLPSSQSQGKVAWAAEEFEHLLDFTGPEPRVDPWRRTSGMHKVRGRRGLGIVRELWLWRDGVAQQRDTSPGRVLPDAAISEIAIANQRATKPPRTVGSAEPRLARSVRRHQEAILEVVARALALPEADLPVLSLPPSGPPPPKAWADRDPVAAARLARARELLGAVSEELAVPVENLLTPDLLRRFLWEGPPAPTTAEVAEALAAMGARRWQTTITAPLISLACSEHPPPDPRLARRWPARVRMRHPERPVGAEVTEK